MPKLQRALETAHLGSLSAEDSGHYSYSTLSEQPIRYGWNVIGTTRLQPWPGCARQPCSADTAAWSRSTLPVERTVCTLVACPWESNTTRKLPEPRTAKCDCLISGGYCGEGAKTNFGPRVGILTGVGLFVATDGGVGELDGLVGICQLAIMFGGICASNAFALLAERITHALLESPRNVTIPISSPRRLTTGAPVAIFGRIGVTSNHSPA